MNEEFFTAGLGAADDEVDIAMAEMDAMAENANNIWIYLFAFQIFESSFMSHKTNILPQDLSRVNWN